MRYRVFDGYHLILQMIESAPVARDWFQLSGSVANGNRWRVSATTSRRSD